MRRLYHSPSSLGLASRCLLAWWYRYVEGVREPFVDWEAVERGDPGASKRRAPALGGAVHVVHQARFEHRPEHTWRYPPESLPGRIAASSFHLLPPPERVELVEAPIGTEPMPSGAPAHAPATRTLIAGVWWAGILDWGTRSPGLGWAEAHGLRDAPLIGDHKNTSSIAKWSKSVDDLRDDLQLNLYAYDACEHYRVESVQCRWVYAETRAVRRAVARDLVVGRGAALDVIDRHAELALRVEALTRREDATPNREACGMYGGCSLHAAEGGPCTVHRLFSAMGYGGRKMGEITAEDSKAFEDYKREQAEKAKAAKAAKAEGGAKKPPAERPKRKPKAKPESAPAAAPAAPPVLATLGAFEAATAEVAQAHAALQAAKQRLAEVVASL